VAGSEGRLLLSTLYSCHARLPCKEAVVRPLEAQDPLLRSFFATTSSYGKASRQQEYGGWTNDRRAMSGMFFHQIAILGLSSLFISKNLGNWWKMEKKTEQK
jgi:hypothetical protein